MIEVKNLHKSFDGRSILNDISVKLEQGRTNLIIGQSGSGKTVFLKSLVGLHEVDSGHILYDGRDFTKMRFKERKLLRKEIGMLFQGGALFDSMTVEENVIFPLNMFTDLSTEEKRERANFFLNRVNIMNANHKFPAEISGGMQKRVAIARAIVLHPQYLFCDEPNSGLDPSTSILIDNLIQEISYELNMTTVVITHDMNSVMEIGDNIIFLYNGQKWWEGTKDEIMHTDNPELNNFVFPSKLMRIIKDQA
jgi:phospholipid/cholesterol/gamma-HCH transport system ATP-binding protein